MDAQPFEVSIPQEKLDDLRERLARTRWSDSFFRMLKLIPPLTDPVSHGSLADSFDVIVASLPGYGFSDRPTERGMSVSRIAGLGARLVAKR
jgi:hypothetical protein